MFTEILAYALALAGLAALLLGLVTGLRSWKNLSTGTRVDLVEACSIGGCLAGGAVLIGMAQLLRLLLAINGKM